MSHSVRVDDASYRLLVERAGVEDRPIARVLRSAIENYGQVSVVVERAGATPKPPSPPGPTAAAMEAERQARCGHPRDRRRVLRWGTVCGQCGAKL